MWLMCPAFCGNSYSWIRCQVNEIGWFDEWLKQYGTVGFSRREQSKIQRVETFPLLSLLSFEFFCKNPFLSLPKPFLRRYYWGQRWWRRSVVCKSAFLNETDKCTTKSGTTHQGISITSLKVCSKREKVYYSRLLMTIIERQTDDGRI